MKRIASVALVLVFCLSLFAMTAFAAPATATLTGPGTVRAGDSITLTFNLNGSGLYGAQGVLSYDKNQLELTGTSQKIGNGWAVEFGDNTFVAYDNNLAKPINSNTALFTVSFKVKSSVAVGTTVKVSYTEVAATDGSSESSIGTVTYSATIAAPASTDNNLKSLTVTNATISPAFSADTTSYTAEVPFSVSKLDVKAEANDGKAKVSINSPNLTPGSTTKVTVTVTAENGSTKTYTISVKREQDPNYVASDNNDLSDITVDGFLLSPGFSADTTEYLIWLPYETDSINLSGIVADSKASVTVEGGDNLVAGADNIIKVICTAEDGTQKVYTIVAKRAPAHDGSTEPTDPPVEPTDPVETEPTEPGDKPSDPTTAPTDPTEPTKAPEPIVVEKTGKIPTMVLILTGFVCLVAGVAIGFFIGKKKNG